MFKKIVGTNESTAGLGKRPAVAFMMGTVIAVWIPLTDKIRLLRSLRDGLHDSGLASGIQTVQEIGHIFAQCTHGLHAFQVLAGLVGIVAMYLVPVLGAYNQHLGDGKVFVDFIECSSGSATAAADDGSGRFEAKKVRAAVKYSVHKTAERSAAGGEMDGRAENEAVGGCCFVDELVDNVLTETMSRIEADIAADTSGNGIVAQPEKFGLDTVLVQHLCHFLQSGISSPVRVRATIDKDNFHSDGDKFLFQLFEQFVDGLHIFLKFGSLGVVEQLCP